MNEHRASDLYLTVNQPPTLRTENGFILIDQKQLTYDDINEIINTVLTARQKRDYENLMELNTSLDMGKYGRFRLNALRQRQFPALVVRRIISKIPSFNDLRLPKVLEKLSLEKHGLVLLTGMTGSGKSTTLASMVDYRNTLQEGHIITIEDPIEYYHEHKKSVVTQREVGVDTESYAVALKNALRQRPDVIQVGEIRDSEVMEHALTAAGTGHLCLSTIHTTNSYQAIERIVNMFPEDYASQIRLNLSVNLQAIVSQRLVPSTKGGMVLAVEVLVNQGHVRDLIHKGDISKIKDVMEQNVTTGMCSFDQSFLQLYMQGLISEEVALSNADKQADLKVKLQQIKLPSSKKPRSESGLSLDTSAISFKD